jgi:hypothetical protein
MTMWIVLSILLSACLAYALVKPLFQPALGGVAHLSGHDSRRALLDKKERVLRSLKDLELDHSMGKVSDEDFESSRRTLSIEVGRILDEIKRHGGH